jgi:DNA-binding MarR family transcriptional regulator
MMGNIQHAILRLLESAGPLPVRDVANRLELTACRAASCLHAGAQRGHIARLDDPERGKPVFSITRDGVKALTALECLQQRLDEKRHAPRRRPTSDEQAQRTESAQLHVAAPFIDPKFALLMARTLHSSHLPLNSSMRHKLAKIIQEAA